MNANDFQGIGNRVLRKTGIFIAAICTIALFASTGTEMITNGDFSSTVLTNWTLAKADSVNVSGAITSGQYVVTRAAAALAGDTNSWNIQFSRKSLSMEKGKIYTVSYSAKSDSTFSMDVNVGMNKDPWTTYSGFQQATVTNVLDTFSFEFTMDTTDAGARLVFDLGRMRAMGKITLDNISMKASGAVIDPSGELIKNGDFSSTSLTNWAVNIKSGSGAAATKSVVNGQLVVDITKMGSPDPTNYDVQLSQIGLKLVKGKEYQVTWKAKSDSIYQMGAYVGMNKDPWGMYSSYNGGNVLTPDWDSTYLYTFAMDSADDVNGRIAFDIGDVAGGGARKVYFDNISMKCTNCNTNVGEVTAISKQTPQLRAIFKNRILEIAGVSSPSLVHLYNSTGKEIITIGEMAPNKGTISIALKRTIAKGVYFARIVEKSAQKNLSSSTVRLIRHY
jgi:hypothetical protein